MKKETALFLGITLGFAFLTGLFWGSGGHMGTFVPYLCFIAIILLAISMVLFGSRQKQG
jgi:hypothetical protein